MAVNINVPRKPSTIYDTLGVQPLAPRPRTTIDAAPSASALASAARIRELSAAPAPQLPKPKKGDPVRVGALVSGLGLATQAFSKGDPRYMAMGRSAVETGQGISARQDHKAALNLAAQQDAMRSLISGEASAAALEQQSMAEAVSRALAEGNLDMGYDSLGLQREKLALDKQGQKYDREYQLKALAQRSSGQGDGGQGEVKPLSVSELTAMAKLEQDTFENIIANVPDFPNLPPEEQNRHIRLAKQQTAVRMRAIYGPVLAAQSSGAQQAQPAPQTQPNKAPVVAAPAAPVQKGGPLTQLGDLFADPYTWQGTSKGLGFGQTAPMREDDFTWLP